MVALVEKTNRTLRARGVSPDIFRVLFTYAFAASVAVFAGMVSAEGKLGLVAIFAGAIVGTAVLISRHALLWFIVIGGIVVTGAMQLYIPGSKYIRYIVPLATFLLVLIAVMDRVANRDAKLASYSSPISNWLLAFMGIAAVSTAVNMSNTGVIIMGTKGYFQMWALFFGLIFIRWHKEVIDSIPKGMLVIALVQLPFVIHQYLVLAPKRQGMGGGVVAVDVVAGTFGASMWGGGANAVLAAFMMIMLGCIWAMWKNGALSTPRTVLLSVLFLSPIFVNQAKISALYLPLVFVFVFYRDILRAPVKSLGAATAAAILLAGLLTALTVTQQSGKIDNWGDLVAFTIERQTASTNERRGQFSELSRYTALTFWAKEHLTANPAYTLIGHGPGASRVQDGGLDLATTLAETRYAGMQIGYTGLSAILWDTGIIGLVLVLGAFAAAFNTASWLANYYQRRDPTRAGIFEGLRAGVMVLALSLAHKDFFVFHIPYQTLVMLVFGYLAVSRIQVQQHTE